MLHMKVEWMGLVGVLKDVEGNGDDIWFCFVLYIYGEKANEDVGCAIMC